MYYVEDRKCVFCSFKDEEDDEDMDVDEDSDDEDECTCGPERKVAQRWSQVLRLATGYMSKTELLTMMQVCRQFALVAAIELYTRPLVFDAVASAKIFIGVRKPKARRRRRTKNDFLRLITNVTYTEIPRRLKIQLKRIFNEDGLILFRVDFPLCDVMKLEPHHRLWVMRLMISRQIVISKRGTSTVPHSDRAAYPNLENYIFIEDAAAPFDFESIDPTRWSTEGKHAHVLLHTVNKSTLKALSHLMCTLTTQFQGRLFVSAFESVTFYGLGKLHWKNVNGNELPHARGEETLQAAMVSFLLGLCDPWPETIRYLGCAVCFLLAGPGCYVARLRPRQSCVQPCITRREQVKPA